MTISPPTVVKGAPRVEFKDSSFPYVIFGNVPFQVAAKGKDLRKLTLHLRGPIGLPTEKDRVIQEVESSNGAETLSFDGTVNLSNVPPGRYVYYADARTGAGLVGKTYDRDTRIAPSAAKPRVMFDSDYTHILNVESPYNTNAASWATRWTDASLTKGKIQAAFKEILSSGTDTLVLSPGIGDVLWVRNSYYPMSKHRDWWKAKTGTLPKASPNLNYTLNGGDPVDDAREVADAFHKRLFVSIRMNDGHQYYVDKWLNAATGQILAPESGAIYQMYSQFLSTRTGLQIGDDASLPSRRYRYLLDYAKGTSGEDPVTHLKNNARDHKVALIKGLLDEHRVDGIVLDFMRLSYMFNTQQTPLSERQEIMKRLISDIRAHMDKRYTGKPGDVPQLFVRIPVLPEEWAKLGVAIPDLALAGVDGFVFSFERFWSQPFYYKGKNGETLLRLDTWKTLVGSPVSFIYEMNYTTENRQGKLPTTQKDYVFFRRTQPEMFLSGAFAANRLGADGFYLFNMPYYRGVDSYSDPETKVTPPFALFDCLKSVSCMGYINSPYYFLSPKGPLNYKSLPDDAFQLPQAVTESGTRLVMYAPAPLSGWPAAASTMRLRIEREDSGPKLAKVLINGVELKEIKDVSEPYASPFKYGVCVPSRTQAFEVPISALTTSRLEITVFAAPGTQPTVHWVDLSAVHTQGIPR